MDFPTRRAGEAVLYKSLRPGRRSALP